MDVVDGQIIDTLCRLDPNFFDSLQEIPSSITELRTDTFYQAIVMLVWSCRPTMKKEIPSRFLPQNMSTKFRCVTTVVDAVKSIGVRDPIDYHMLLYGRSKELRNILIGLMEKLPKDSSVVTSVEDPLKDLMRSANREEGDKEGFLTRFNSPQKQAISTRVDFIGFSGDVMVALHYDDWRYRHSAVICSLLENNAVHNIKAQNYQSLRHGILENLRLRFINEGVKLQLKPKPVISLELQKKKTKDKQEIDPKVNVEKNEMLNELLSEVVALTAYVDRKKISNSRMQSDETERLLVLRNKRFQEAEVDGRLKKLLENPNAVLKLESYIDGSDERMQHLQNLWLKAKAEKDEEVKRAQLTAALSLSSDSREISSKDAKLIENELADKKKVLEKLKKEVESREKKQINRNIYTKHIFDVVGNIRKQQNEINKIAAENLYLQREIKSSAGKLERSFTVVEGKLYKDVEKDTFMQKAYRLLMKIHSECSCAITGIDSAGQIEREIEELNDQIATQYQKNINEKLECIVNDWMQIRKENMALKELLKECDN
uniref:Coiled-coil domain-containing protein 22 homolog n=2 Tax=Wuchereria bancrofti TaxID=6293 RepID=A0AAF5PGK7_WUCBA